MRAEADSVVVMNPISPLQDSRSRRTHVPGATLRLPLAIESRAFGAQEAEYTNNT